MNWIKERFRELSTYVGLGLSAAAQVIPQYVNIRPELAWVGVGVGVLLMIRKEKGSA